MNGVGSGATSESDESPALIPVAGAGQSARDEAARVELVAARLESKAKYARRRAANFGQGAEGELETARALAELSIHGWQLIHDRRLAHGGNIDHLAVGPGGIVVVDAKNWSGDVTVSRDGGLRVGGLSRARQAQALAEAAGAVETALAKAGHHVKVRALMALTQEPPPERRAVALPEGPVVVGVADLAATLQRLPLAIAPADVDRIVVAVLAAFPPGGQALAPVRSSHPIEAAPPRNLFLKGNVFLFVEPWARGGKRRLYLNDDLGRSLGFKDLVSGELQASDASDAPLVRGILRNAHPGGLGLALSELPKIPTRLPGGRILGRLGGLWCNFLVAHHWRGGGKDRLYVTQASLDQGIFNLGYIDLSCQSLHPSSAEPLTKDLRPPRRYLEIVQQRYPRKH